MVNISEQQHTSATTGEDMCSINFQRMQPDKANTRQENITGDDATGMHMRAGGRGTTVMVIFSVDRYGQRFGARAYRRDNM